MARKKNCLARQSLSQLAKLASTNLGTALTQLMRTYCNIIILFAFGAVPPTPLLLLSLVSAYMHVVIGLLFKLKNVFNYTLIHFDKGGLPIFFSGLEGSPIFSSFAGGGAPIFSPTIQ